MRHAFAGPLAAAPETSFLDDVLRGLSREPKALPCKYFYDARGSALFDQICELPEYYLTRTELQIMQAHAPEMAECFGENALVVEFGSGSSVKTRLLLEELARPAGYLPVDISGEHLEQSAAQLRREYPALKVVPVHADFTRDFELPPGLTKAASRTVVYFPGSTIGNFTTSEARDMLRAIARLAGARGRLLLGTDLVKAPAELEAAYDDPGGVTAAFNLNLLTRINRELGGDFDPRHFAHVARYDSARARVEISIESTRRQTVRVAGRRFDLAPAERILTEYSHKYTLDGLGRLAAEAGLEIARTWTDPRRRFAVQYLAVSG